MIGTIATIIEKIPSKTTYACETYAFFLTGIKSSSYFILALIALDRCKIIKEPFSNRCNVKSAKTAIFILIFTAFLVGVPPLFGVSNYIFDFTVNTCSVDWCEKGVSGNLIDIFSKK